jgi:hypothetical protein
MKSWMKNLAETLAPLLLGIDVTDGRTKFHHTKKAHNQQYSVGAVFCACA